MSLSVLRRPLRDERLPAQPLPPADQDRFDDVYVAVSETGQPRWQVVVLWGDYVSAFREELVWNRAGVVAIGGGAMVYLLDQADGGLRARVEMPDGFAHLGLDRSEATLFLLGWTDIVALDTGLTTLWHARDVAVDGLVFHGAGDGWLHVGAEMDPPGGWFDVTLDATTGREAAREPNFSPGYAGIYGNRDRSNPPGR